MILRVSPQGNDSNNGSSWPLAKRTVQAGVDAAAAIGGEVWVAAGLYPEQITLRRYVHLYGGFDGTQTGRDQRDWNANPTILDGQRNGSVVAAEYLGHGLSTIDGFTITNGSGTVSGSSTYGGGVYLSYSSPAVANNTIKSNSASYGGGLYLYYSCSPMRNNTIEHNSASLRGSGAYFVRCDSRITDNTITGNSGSAEGGGLYLAGSCPTIRNNTIAGNGAPAGGGLYVAYSSSPVITNSIIAANSSGLYKAVGSPVLHYNCICGNAAYDFSGLTDPTGTNGNISADPLLVRLPSPGADGVWGTADDDHGDLHLSLGSPCINTGDPGYQATGDETDIDGEARVLSGRVDIGADEVARLMAGDIDGDGGINIFDIFVIAEAWNTARGEANYNPAADLDADGAVNIFDVFVVAENWSS